MKELWNILTMQCFDYMQQMNEVVINKYMKGLYKTMRDKDIDKRRNLSHSIFIQYRKWKLISSDWKPSSAFPVGWCREEDKREVLLRHIRASGSGDCVWYFDHDGDFMAGCVWMMKLIKVYTLCVCSLLCFICSSIKLFTYITATKIT